MPVQATRQQTIYCLAFRASWLFTALFLNGAINPTEKHMGVRCLLQLQALARPFIRIIEEESTTAACGKNVLCTCQRQLSFAN